MSINCSIHSNLWVSVHNKSRLKDFSSGNVSFLALVGSLGTLACALLADCYAQIFVHTSCR